MGGGKEGEVGVRGVGVHALSYHNFIRYYVYLAFYLGVVKHLWLREWQKKSNKRKMNQTNQPKTKKPNKQIIPQTLHRHTLVISRWTEQCLLIGRLRTTHGGVDAWT